MKYTLLLILLPMTSLAEIPFTFEANTPAKASEVNANFLNLDNKIINHNNTISKRISDLEKALPSNKCDFVSQSPVNISYSKKAGYIGLNQTPSGYSFEMAKLPFIDIASGYRYTIMMPTRTGAVMTELTDPTTFCQKLMISNFPAYYDNVRVTRGSIFKALPDFPSGIMYQVSVDVYILVGSTTVYINVYDTVDELTAYYTSPSEFVTSLVFDQMVDHPDVITAIDDMIDYIEIVRVP